MNFIDITNMALITANKSNKFNILSPFLAGFFYEIAFFSVKKTLTQKHLSYAKLEYLQVLRQYKYRLLKLNLY